VSCQALSVAEGEFLHAIWPESSGPVPSRASALVPACHQPNAGILKSLRVRPLWQPSDHQRGNPAVGSRPGTRPLLPSVLMNSTRNPSHRIPNPDGLHPISAVLPRVAMRVGSAPGSARTSTPWHAAELCIRTLVMTSRKVCSHHSPHQCCILYQPAWAMSRECRAGEEPVCDCVLWGCSPTPWVCHCEEHGDEAISTPRGGDCFAALAMTERARHPTEFSHTQKPGAPAPATGARGYSGVWPSI
jgi:hypothetical protein